MFAVMKYIVSACLACHTLSLDCIIFDMGWGGKFEIYNWKSKNKIENNSD